MGAKGMKTKFTALCVRTRDHIHYLYANLKNNLKKRKEILTFAENRYIKLNKSDSERQIINTLSLTSRT